MKAISGRLPDGDFELALVEEGEMAEDEFIRLEAALHDGLDDVKQGRTRSAADVAATLVRRHG